MPLWGNSPRQTDTEHRETYLYVGDLFQLIILILRRDPRRWRNVLLVVGLSQRFRSHLHFYREPQRQKALQNWSRGGLRVRVAICLGLGRISICLCQEDYLYPETRTTFYWGWGPEEWLNTANTNSYLIAIITIQHQTIEWWWWRRRRHGTSARVAIGLEGRR